MAEKLVRKKHIMAGHRGSSTRMLSRVDGMLASHDGVDTSKLAQLKLRLQDKLDTLKQLDGGTIDLVEEKDLADEIDLAKEGIYTAMVNIDKCSKAPPTSALPSSTIDPITSPRANPVKLPNLTIRPFNGDTTSWTTFWDSFESAIDNSSGLSEIDKFNYLKSLLEKSAAEAVSGLTLTTDNYKEAVSILKKRFGNKQQIISKLMDILLNWTLYCHSISSRACDTCMI